MVNLSEHRAVYIKSLNKKYENGELIENVIFDITEKHINSHSLSDFYMKEFYIDRISNYLKLGKKKKFVTRINKIDDYDDMVEFIKSKPFHKIPKYWKDCIDRNKSIEIFTNNNIEYSKSYKCSKCGKNESNVATAQTRSADEPMTIFVTCIHCGYSFKF